MLRLLPFVLISNHAIRAIKKCTINDSGGCDLDCIGSDACKGETLKCSQSYDCMVRCNGNNSCANTKIKGMPASDLTVICDGYHACEGNTQISCGSNSNICNVTCATEDSCVSLYVDASKTKEFVCQPSAYCDVTAPFTTKTSTPTVFIPTTTLKPTTDPTISPTNIPAINPTKRPSMNPTKYPSMNPTKYPLMNPIKDASLNPTKYTSMNPTKYPTMKPTKQPSESPTTPSPQLHAKTRTKTPTFASGKVIEVTVASTTTQNAKSDTKQAANDRNETVPYIATITCIVLVACVVFIIIYKKSKSGVVHISSDKSLPFLENEYSGIIKQQNAVRMFGNITNIETGQIDTNDAIVVDHKVQNTAIAAQTDMDSIFCETTDVSLGEMDDICVDKKKDKQGEYSVVAGDDIVTDEYEFVIRGDSDDDNEFDHASTLGNDPAIENRVTIGSIHDIDVNSDVIDDLDDIVNVNSDNCNEFELEMQTMH